MRVTERAMTEFAMVLDPADLPQPGRQARPQALPGHVLESLIRFEGALAWEGGEPRTTVPPTAVGWAQEVWLAGWDDMYAQYGAREH